MLCSSDELIGGHQTHLCCDDLVVLSARDEGFVGNWDTVEDGYGDSGGDLCWLRGVDEADDQLPEDFADRCVFQVDFTHGQMGVGEAGDPVVYDPIVNGIRLVHCRTRKYLNLAPELTGEEIFVRLIEDRLFLARLFNSCHISRCARLEKGCT